MKTELRVKAEKLQIFASRLFEAAGTPQDIAETVSEILVNANLKGHDSHGVLHIPGYISQIEQKHLIPDERPKILRQTPSTALVDARKGWGHYVARWSMALAMEKAHASGMASVSIAHCTHIGRLGEYAEQAAAKGYIGMVTGGWGGPGTGPAAPFGGSAKALSTNPIAVGVPTEDAAPFILDFATTMVANAKIHLAHIKGTKLPPGCIVDKHGQPSLEPTDYFDGGSLLIFGGHKGYALSLMTCLLGGLTGDFDPDTHQMGSTSPQAIQQMGGVFLQAIDVRAFRPINDYQKHVRSFLDGIKAIPPAPGFSEVLVPGDVEQRAYQERSVKGVELPETVWKQLKACAEKFNLQLELI
jgi:LDH2 family malate/lactate/ureidoglycolate dehydrogenase